MPPVPRDAQGGPGARAARDGAPRAA